MDFFAFWLIHTSAKKCTVNCQRCQLEPVRFLIYFGKWVKRSIREHKHHLHVGHDMTGVLKPQTGLSTANAEWRNYWLHHNLALYTSCPFCFPLCIEQPPNLMLTRTRNVTPALSHAPHRSESSMAAHFLIVAKSKPSTCNYQLMSHGR